MSAVNVEEPVEKAEEAEKKPAVIFKTKKKVETKKADTSEKAFDKADSQSQKEEGLATKPTVKKSKGQAIQDKMATERRAKVATARKEIDKEDKKKFQADDEQAAVSRERVKKETADRVKKETKVTKTKEKAVKASKEERKAARQQASEERQAARGRTKCTGSNLDVEKEKLTLTTGKLRENPWSKKGKRVRCPRCNRSVGIHVVGRKSQQKTPTGYKLNTHYVRVTEDGKKIKVSAKAKKPVKKAAAPTRAQKRRAAAKRASKK